MNKSTPLSQLPNALQQQTSFVNDQQKQMVTSAQAAVQNIPIPQNTQIPPEIINDDDATIQEVLNQINAHKSNPNHQQDMMAPPPPSQNHNSMSQHMMMEPPSYGMMPPPPAFPSALYPPSMMSLQQQSAPTAASSAGGNVEIFLNVFADDIKLASLVFAVFLAVHFLPVGSFLGRYIAIDRIPYHDVLLKGLLAAVVVILAKKMISPKCERGPA